MHRLKLPGLTFLIAMLVQAVAPTAASAYDMRVEAVGVCVNNSLQINFSVTELFSLGNPEIAVKFNGSLVYTGAFVAPTYSFSGSAPAPGNPGDTVTVSAVAVGIWADGNPGGQSASTTVQLPRDCNPPVGGVGRFTGGGKSIDTNTGLKVTKGFTIHCDLLLSNNLEINWPGSSARTNQFHMLQHTSAICTDDPRIDQRPPAAPVDKIYGVGTGRFNGTLGYTVEFTLIDAGEPGTADSIGFRVYHTATGVEVLNLPLQNIVGGNVQAHFDQPHKK